MLGKDDKFLLTLYGHSCYTMNILSPQPLEVQFYDARELKSGAGQGVRKLQEANETDSLAVLGDNQDCRNVLNCVQLQEGLSKATVYSLMISRWSNVTLEGQEDLEEGPIPVTVLLEHCDPVSPWHYVGKGVIRESWECITDEIVIGLVFVGSIGFTSTMLLLCVIVEFVFGLRTITKLQTGGQQEQFVELAQIDPLKLKKEIQETEDDAEEPTAPLMTTVIPTDSESTEPEDTEKPSPA
ncbi:hypothetical protein P3T76_013784 [Phytophthora citrophthora]|uniref:Uncharacterized protein n=1 Tax=Phytophthora citrophthora TaxID=4793 RepID=A0AAD9G2L1_9STRA|nr:hypothetical protein P3T76_013784 [Phytophthora citrophthora]